MNIRRYTAADVPEMVEHLRIGLCHFHYGELLFAEDKVLALLKGNLRNPSFTCLLAFDDAGTMLGAIAGAVTEFMTSRQVYAEDYVYFVRPEHRSLRVATGLVAAFVDWARERGCHEVRLDQSTGYKMDKFAALVKRQGFTQIGAKFRMELT